MQTQGVMYTYYEVRANGRTMARFVDRVSARIFIDAKVELRVAAGLPADIKYDVEPVERRSL